MASAAPAWAGKETGKEKGEATVAEVTQCTDTAQENHGVRDSTPDIQLPLELWAYIAQYLSEEKDFSALAQAFGPPVSDLIEQEKQKHMLQERKQQPTRNNGPYYSPRCDILREYLYQF